MNSNQITRFISTARTFEVLNREELVHILTKIKKDKTKGCWFYREDWSVYVIYKKKSLHRLIFSTFKEDIKENNFVCHKCDRPGCINPDHLFQGTSGDNYRDALNKGRVTRSRINNRKDMLKLDRLAELDRRKKLQLPVEYNDAYWSSIRRRIRARNKQAQS